MWIAKALRNMLGATFEGALLPPASTLGVQCKEVDGTDIVILTQGESVDFISGRDEYSIVSMSGRTALRLAWFLLWRYWLRGTWCGIKLHLWSWASRVVQDRELREKIQKAREYAARKRGG